MVQEADRLLQKIIFLTIKRQEKQDVMGILLLRCFVTFLLFRTSYVIFSVCFYKFFTISGF